MEKIGPVIRFSTAQEERKSGENEAGNNSKEDRKGMKGRERWGKI